MKTSRRTFVKKCTALSVVAAVAGISTDAFPKDLNLQTVSHFKAEHREFFIAAMERFIPADDVWGGATEAGCIVFMENWVERYHAEDFKFFESVADSVLLLTNKLYGKNFQDMPDEMQNEFLKKWEKGDIDRSAFGNIRADAAFAKLLDMAMMGFYGSPRHGGNKDFISYRMMGMDVPLPIGQNRYTLSENSRNIGK